MLVLKTVRYTLPFGRKLHLSQSNELRSNNHSWQNWALQYLLHGGEMSVRILTVTDLVTPKWFSSDQ